MDLRAYLVEMAHDARTRAAGANNPALRATLDELADYCDDEVARLDPGEREQRLAG